MAQNGKRPWMERMVEHFLEEAPPKDGEAKLHRAIANLAGLHMNGMDARKVGRFAADVYRLVGRQRAQVIHDMAKLSPPAA